MSDLVFRGRRIHRQYASNVCEVQVKEIDD